MEWKEYFLNIAEQVKMKSKDQSTKIGAVIAGNDCEILSTGYNSFPRGLDDDHPERQERPEKYYYMIHAEENAIINAARIGVSIKNSTIYLTCGLPCSNCAKSIINAGIKKIVCKNTINDVVGNIWDEDRKRSLIMLKECNIEIEYY
jgi:dCMP deaminase